MSAENQRRIVEAHVEHFIDQMKADSEHHDWFMARLARLANAAKSERQQRPKPQAKGKK